MWPNSRLTDLIRIDHPIIQAPMAGIGGLDMAMSVSNAGALGSIACAAMDANGLRATLTAAEKTTDRPINVNFFAHVPAADDADRDACWLERLAPYYAEMGISPPERLSPGRLGTFNQGSCEVVEEMRPEVVSFHFGLPPADLLRRVRATGAVVMSSATTVEEALWLAANNCDVIIAQGYEAGGHRGMFLTDDPLSQVGTLALVPQIVDAVDVPVIAAGGIGDGRGIAAALALGAAGVQMGSAYLLTSESAIDPLYRKVVQSSVGQPTAVSNVFSGRLSRCVVNRLISERGPVSGDAPAFPRGFSATASLRAKAEELGNADFSAHFRGQGPVPTGQISAGDLTGDLVADATQRIKSMLR